jgi:hypothetical protein
MVSVLASSAVDCGFQPWSDQPNEYKIGVCFFFPKHTPLKSKGWLVNQDNVSEWSYMSTYGLFVSVS